MRARQRWQKLQRGSRALAHFVDEREARSRRVGHDISAEDVQILEQIANSSALGRRFPVALERRFREYVRLSSRAARVSVALLTFLTFAVAPLWVPALFRTPPEMTRLTTLLELALVAPLFALLTIALARRPLSSAVEWALMGAFVIEMAIVEVLRYISFELGFPIAPTITIVVPFAVLSLARLSLDRCALFVAAYVLTVLAVGRFWPDSGAHRDPAHWLVEVLLLNISLLSVLWSRLSLRRQWAASLLLEIMAYRDALTGLANRRAFEEHYEKVVRAVARGQSKTLLFALIDLDHFKRLNDHYGHEYGDGVLAEIGLALSGLARRSLDLAARLGGEEFALLLYDCDAEAAESRLRAIVETIHALQIEHLGNDAGVVTCSAGGALVKPDDVLSDAYRLADARLYAAKRGGRNTYRLRDPA